MMSSHDRAPIVVGVDGTAAARSAIRYGAMEAARTGAPLHLVHVVTAPGSEGDGLLTGAAKLARTTAPEVPVETVLHHGAHKTDLASAARGAAEVVIGSAPGHVLDRLRTDAMSVALAKHAGCPVVVVPEKWRVDPHAPVLVGYKSPDASFGALVTGFDLAAARGRDLVILHAWRLPSGYDDLLSARVGAEDVEQHTREVIESLIADLRALHPEVRVRIVVQRGRAGEALIEAGRHAALLVLPRPKHDGRLLRRASCPIVLGARRPRAAAAALVLESQGRMQR